MQVNIIWLRGIMDGVEFDGSCLTFMTGCECLGFSGLPHL